MPVKQAERQMSAVKEAPRPCTASGPADASILLHSQPRSSASVRRLTIKVSGSTASAKGNPSQLRINQTIPPRAGGRSSRTSVACERLSHRPKSSGSVRCFKAAPVERPVTRRYKLQQEPKSSPSVKLGSPAHSKESVQRKSTLTHQHKRSDKRHLNDASTRRLPASGQESCSAADAVATVGSMSSPGAAVPPASQHSDLLHSHSHWPFACWQLTSLHGQVTPLLAHCLLLFNRCRIPACSC